MRLLVPNKQTTCCCQGSILLWPCIFKSNLEVSSVDHHIVSPFRTRLAWAYALIALRYLCNCPIVE